MNCPWKPKGIQSQDEMPEGMRLALEAGIGHEREYVRFWSGMRDRAPEGE